MALPVLPEERQVYLPLNAIRVAAPGGFVNSTAICRAAPAHYAGNIAKL